MAFPAIIAAVASAAMSKNAADNAEEQNRQANKFGADLQGASTQAQKPATVKGASQTNAEYSAMKPQQQQDKGALGGLMDNLSDGSMKSGKSVGKGADGKGTGGKGSWVDIVKGIISSAASSGSGGSAGVSPVQVENYGAPMISDERLKNRERLERIFQDDGAIDAFSKIDAFVYNYTDKAQKMNGKKKGVDNNPHFGPIAQDLAKNPVTSGTVHKDENGFLNVDTRQLSLTNTAMISQLARKVQELEERLGGR